MSLSAERLAIADGAVQRTFERTSVTWQALPHWDTNDPGQVRVRNDVTFSIAGVAAAPPVPQPANAPLGAGSVGLNLEAVQFRMTLGQVTAATPDALLSAVISRTVELAQRFDAAVLRALSTPATPAAVGVAASPWYIPLAAPAGGVARPQMIVAALITGRRLLEDSGYRAPCCLIASTAHFTDLYQWVGSRVATDGLLVAANANSLHRATQLDGIAVPGAGNVDLMLMVGRTQQIPHGSAGSASPGEEPVDLAVSVPPSLEVIGENAAGEIELAVRTRFAARVTDERGVIVFHT